MTFLKILRCHAFVEGSKISSTVMCGCLASCCYQAGAMPQLCMLPTDWSFVNNVVVSNCWLSRARLQPLLICQIIEH